MVDFSCLENEFYAKFGPVSTHHLDNVFAKPMHVHEVQKSYDTQPLMISFSDCSKNSSPEIHWT